MIARAKNSVIAMVLLGGLTACGETPTSEMSAEISEQDQLKADTNAILGKLTQMEQNRGEAIGKPDFASIADVNQKKTAFFDYLRPAVEHENRRVEKERQFLVQLQKLIQSGDKLESEKVFYAKKLGKNYSYDLASDIVTESWLEEMLNRVDVLPESLVLSQAANESGWGTSRFAVEGNNYFGQWCYRKGCGLIPASRKDDATHEVAVFDSAYLSVQAYFMNVNRNRAYQDLRDIRTAQRQAGNTIEGSKLAEGLIQYSERGHAYIEEIQAMIKHNNQYWRQG
ncbi:glucosaminidase domain-containing protein [Photobacterium minamisatsumaniensis]|uniref:glucosaminidase domain-containing protein n=1 Tax=Photobacterium minamisatsumaniensis TaxID=2910233 RepID=UPI003D145778